MDLEDGREGGTWLGMNKNGQVGVLLNILQPIDNLTFGKKHRGKLIRIICKNNKIHKRISGPTVSRVRTEGRRVSSFTRKHSQRTCGFHYGCH